MRGRPLCFNSSSFASGNTPAYAGKTRAPQEVCSQKEKHPRVCGEDFVLHMMSL